MRRSPPIVPQSDDRDVYLVLDELGRLGRVWRETDEDRTDRATLIRDLIEGQYSGPVQVIAFNIAEGWSRDASEEIAEAVAQACAKEGRYIPVTLEDFVDQHHTPAAEQLPLPLLPSPFAPATSRCTETARPILRI